jgi:uncharacterized protein (UPF0335 family)
MPNKTRLNKNKLAQGDKLIKELKDMVKEIEDLEAEKKDIQRKLNYAYKKARDGGQNITALRKVIRMKNADSEKTKREEEAIMVYKQILGV